MGEYGWIRKILIIAIIVGIAVWIVFGDEVIKQMKTAADVQINSPVEELLR